MHTPTFTMNRSLFLRQRWTLVYGADLQSTAVWSCVAKSRWYTVGSRGHARGGAQQTQLARYANKFHKPGARPCMHKCIGNKHGIATVNIALSESQDSYFERNEVPTRLGGWLHLLHRTALTLPLAPHIFFVTLSTPRLNTQAADQYKLDPAPSKNLIHDWQISPVFNSLSLVPLFTLYNPSDYTYLL